MVITLHVDNSTRTQKRGRPIGRKLTLVCRVCAKNFSAVPSDVRRQTCGDCAKINMARVASEPRNYTKEWRLNRADVMREVLINHKEARMAAILRASESRKIKWACAECGKAECRSPSHAARRKFCGNDCAKASKRKELGLPIEAGTTRREIENWRYRNDVQFRLGHLLRKRIRKFVAQKMKSASTMELLGCTRDEFRLHLEKQFTRGMTWENAGEWEIDHIIPCAKFDLSDAKHQRMCFHFSNMQPMWKMENIKKRDTLQKHEQLPLT